MTEQEQIEEMAREIAKSYQQDCRNIPFQSIRKINEHGVCEADMPTCLWCKVARCLFAAGYRKQVEGEWLFEFTLNGDYFYECSVCSRQAVLNGLCDVSNPAISHPYCHCGAKMKGGEQG